MLSGRDIDDWGNGAPEGQTATNGIGWCVEWLSEKGWTQLSLPYSTKGEALDELPYFQEMWPKYEYRVYEVLK